MYTEFFGLRSLPFEDRADVRFFHASAEHDEAVAAMQYEVQHGSGIGLILGDPGSGKTMIIRALLQRLTENEKVVVVTVPGNGATDLLRETCKGFGVSLSASVEDARGLARLRRHFSRLLKQGNRPVLIIDQAENISPGDLVDVESLLDLQENRGRLLRVVLAADPRFQTLLDQPVFSRLRQLAFTEHTLTRLTQSETADYISHRLMIAGASRTEIFTDDAIALIHHQSRGVPRVINQVSNAALLAAYGAGENRVTARQLPMGGTSDEAEERDETPAIAFTGENFEVESEVPEWDDAYRDETPFDEAAPVQSELDSLVRRAEAAAESLQRNVPQSVDFVQGAEKRLSQLLLDSRRQIHSLESRLVRETQRADQAAQRLERAEQATTRAEQLEARLSAFAEQLTDQMEQVQRRVADMMKFSSPLDEARGRLENSIRQAEISRSNMDDAVESAVSRMVRRIEETQTAVDKAASEVLTSAGQRVRQFAESLKDEGLALIEKSERSIKTLAGDIHRKLVQTSNETEAKVESAAQSVAEQIALCEQRMSRLQETGAATEQSVQSAAAKAGRNIEELRQAGDQVRLSVQCARESAEQLRTLQADASKWSVRFNADVTEARQFAEQLSGLTFAADQKAGQLASIQTAIAHLHERAGKLMTTAHPLVERADQTVGRLEAAMTQAEKSRSQLSDQEARILGDVTAQIERAAEIGERAHRESRELRTGLDAAEQLVRQLSLGREQVASQQARLDELLSQAATWSGKFESLQTTITGAEQSGARLRELVDSAASVMNAAPQLIERTQKQRQALEEMSTAIESLLSNQHQAEQSARQAVEQAGQFIAAFESQIASGEARLGEYHAQTAQLEDRVGRAGARTEMIEQAGAKLDASINEAHAQAENLERVCVAVRKVFAGLSQATLTARTHAREVEDFLTSANQTAGSLKRWLESIRSRIDGVIGERESAEPAWHAHADAPAIGVVSREAELSLAGEQGAASAHMVEGGMSRTTAPYSTQAKEISELIEKARIAQTTGVAAELAGSTQGA